MEKIATHLEKDEVSTRAIRSDGEITKDCSMYRGTAGVLFSLYRYILLVRQEASKQKKTAKEV